MENNVHQIHVCHKSHARGVNERGFEAWKGFIESCIAWDVTEEKEIARLREETAYIQRFDLAEYFWFLYTTCRALQYNGGGFLQQGATDFYSLYYLGVIQQNPLHAPFEGKLLQNGIPKSVFCVPKGRRDWLVEYLQKAYGAEVVTSGQKCETTCLSGEVVAVEIVEKEDF